MDKQRVLLFGMTGFGNNAFNVLLKLQTVELVAVVSPKRYVNPFPYYECAALQDVVSKHKDIKFFENLSMRARSTHSLIRELSPDLIIVSTFNQIIPQEILSIPHLGVINIHPSLLPKYRGPTPTVWVLLNGEKETGVTAHFIEDERIDSGRIITQHILKIDPIDNNGTLRYKLGMLSEKVLSEAIAKVLNKSKEKFQEQDESMVFYYPRPAPTDAEIDIQRPLRESINKIRAFTPYPGAYIKHKGTIYIVRNASMVQKYNSHISLKEANGVLFIKTPEGITRFETQKKDRNGKEN